VGVKLINFLDKSENPKLGCLSSDKCIDLTIAIDDGRIEFPCPASIIEDVLHVPEGLEILSKQFPKARNLTTLELSSVRLLAPILHPSKLIGIGFNYRDHAEETKKPIPKEPLFFAMFASAISNPGAPVVIPSISQMVDYEAELAVVIGQRGRHIGSDQALEHVAGFTAFNDVSARNFLATDSQWLRVKSFDTFAPMGPCLVTRDEVPDGSGLNIELRVNGETRQKSNTRHLIFDVAYLVSYISSVMTLEVGDVIATGTPSGVGYARNPPVFLKAGDVVEVDIEKIGVLRNPFVDAS